MIAAEYGRDNMVLMLLDHPNMTRNSINKKNHDGNTAFMIAVKHKQEKIMILLTERSEVDVNIQNKKGDTAAHIVLKQYIKIATQKMKVNNDYEQMAKGYQFMEKLLQRDDLDINLKNQCQETPLLMLRKHRLAKMLALFQKN